MNRSTKLLKYDPYRLLLENLEDYAICVLDVNGLIVTWNAGAQKLTGFSADEIIGQHFCKLYPLGDLEHDKPDRLLNAAARDGRINDEGWRARKDGGQFWASIALTALRDESGKLRGFGEIVREVKDKEVSLTITNLEKANRMKDDFLAMVSHELLTPLTSAVGWIKLLRDGRLSPRQVQHAIEVIDRNLMAQRDLVEDLLNVSRVLSGKLTVHLQRVSLGPIIQQTIDSLQPLIDAKQLRIEVDLDLDTDTVNVDPVRFQQIVWNLLTNAVKFTPIGGSIRVQLKRGDNQAILSVSDTGEGISREFLPYVFDRFRQADSARPERHGGLGLGLSIVRHLVELHGGSVSANSRGPGQGSTFSVSLPMPSENSKPRMNQRSFDASFVTVGAVFEVQNWNRRKTPILS
jgi:PAS domain S-box-containing protein